jgi:transglutaminase-like putative cysteine protease
MGRTALLALLPALLIATGWQRLEDPVLASHFSLAAALAIVVALVPRRRLRVVLEIAAFMGVAAVGFGLSLRDALPFDGDRDFFGPLLSRFGNGVIDFYEVGLPFDPGERVRMHGVLVLAVFAFTLLATLAIAARRPILAAATTFAGAAWPMTLVPEQGSTVRGALLLAAALILLASLRPGVRRGSGQAALVGGAVVVVALVAVSSPSVAKGGFLDWKTWEPYTRSAPPVSVQYVWDADYDGIDFPKKPTTVLKVNAPRRSPYWRATTLDVFLDDHWRENAPGLEPVPDGDRDALIGDPYLPPQAAEPLNWMRQVVTVEALQDTHLVAASVPVAFEAGAAASYGSGIAYVGRLHRGQDYQAWSYAPQPTPSELTVSKANYSGDLVFPFLAVDAGVSVPAFGVRGREEMVQDLFRDDGSTFLPVAQYGPLYRLARRVVGRPRNPYAAVVALEAWFRTGGDFTYDEKPPIRVGAPPLVSFVTQTRRGYCQHFAGAMALMLRYLGIPARVAAGFTTGRYDQEAREWTVADTNAHTWVEVWFEGYGWLPFDPTPGRGRLRGSYTASSLFFDADGATAAFAGASAGVVALGLDILRSRAGGGSPDDRDRPRGPDAGAGSDAVGQTTTPGSGGRNDVRLLGILLLAALGVVTAFWVAKTGKTRARYLTSDPRRVASAVRSELVDYLADQRVLMSASATPAELGAAVRASLRVDADRLADALGTARFGPADEAEEAARAARRELRTVLRAVRRRLTGKARFRGLLSLRSLGLRST